MSEKSKEILKKQKILLVAIGIGAFFIAIGISYLTIRTPGYVPPPSKSVDLPGDKINPQDIWMNRIESENKVIDQEIKVLKEILLNQTQQQEAREKEKQDLKKEISQLKQELRTFSEKPVSKTEIKEGDPFFIGGIPPQLPLPVPGLKICEVVMEEDEARKVGNVNKSIPANVTAKAVLISGLDATCGAYATSNPIPVKLRIIEDAYGYDGVSVKLKGAIISASAYGNLSDERVYMRLERLTQFNSNDEYVETEVSGYVTGEDGKYGLRGKMADKSLQIIKNAAVSGLFAETSQVLQSALSRYTIDNVLTSQSGAAGYGEVGQGAFGRTSNAFDMLSEYYIKRAEQISPVIQVNPGRIVDVTFIHGADIGDIHTKEKIQIVRETTREKENEHIHFSHGGSFESTRSKE